MQFAIVPIEDLSEEDWLRSGMLLWLNLELRQLVDVYGSDGERVFV